MSDIPPHKPFVPPEQTIPELTFPAVVMGAVLGIVFAASSTYLGLKVGLTVSASIPVAVLSITLFRWFKLRGTILENNIAQTTGSAGESLAAGVAFTLPSLLLMGFEVELIRVLLVALLGGLIGVLMMIPLRHGLIVKEHGKLTYPEGTACADVLIVGEKGGTDARNVFLGFFVGLFYAIFNLILKFWNPDGSEIVTNAGGLKKASVAFETSPPMLGVGYIIGPKVSANMLGGGILAFLVLIPLLAMYGPASIADMSPHQIRTHYVLYIGAGAVAAGGFIALGRSIPTIISAFRRGMGSMKTGEGGAKGGGDKVPRTERDLSMKVVLGGSLALAVAIFAAPVLNIDFLTALLVIVFGFFFVTVSSRITGEIGSSSNPISGMTIATLLLTCGLFVLIGRTGVGYKAMALSTAALVCVAASNGGTISQDLKTGYLVGATPRLQQISIAIGVVTSAIVIGFVMLLFLGSRNTFPAVDYPGVTMIATSSTMKGPDGKTYKVAWERDTRTATDGQIVTRGKYMIDDAGVPQFLVSTSVDQAYPWKLVNEDVQLPTTFKIQGKKAINLVAASHPGVALPAVATTATGPDGKPYRLAVSDGAHASGRETVPAGTYLIDDAGVPRFFVDDSTQAMSAAHIAKAKIKSVDLPASALTPSTDTEAGPDGTSYRLAIVAADDPALAGKKVSSGTYLIDATGEAKFKKSVIGEVTGTDLGIDRQHYKVVEFSEGIASINKGRYLVSDAGKVAYRAKASSKFDAPKAQLFALIIDGTLGGNLPWGLVLIGVFIAIILELLGVASLPFAVGLYLPISTSGGIFVGGAVRWLVDRKRRGESESAAEFSPGMLMASGLIAGGSIAGVLQAGLLQFDVDGMFDLSGAMALFTNTTWWPMVPFLAMALGLYYIGTRKAPGPLPVAEVVDSKKD